jgi:hypothetical protein
MAQGSLTKSVGRLIGTATELGAALAGAVDKATAGDREPTPAPPDETPAAAMIRHSASAVANVTRIVVNAAQDARAAASDAGAETDGPRADTSSRAAGAGARVHQGTTLRVPLSIENPGREPMRGLEPAVARWRTEADDPAAPGTARFVPERLDIEPLDFEKLTVFVDIDAESAPGAYRLDIDLGQGPEVAIDFIVLPAAAD